jgi:hypothetical protein
VHKIVGDSPSSVGGLGNYRRRLEGLVKLFWMMFHSMSTLSVKIRQNERGTYSRKVHD